jgi:HEAT repeat protein
MVEGLDRIVADAEAGSPKRIATIDTLGDMRDPIVVPALIGALGDPNTDVVEAARRGLTTVTRQDFGDESRRWLTWWGSNSSRHRIEWLIDALTHELPALRRLAGQELKAITKEYFGYYDDLPKKERERAQLRYRDWWKTEGRARFRRA